jgi:hypothetical protein
LDKIIQRKWLGENLGQRGEVGKGKRADVYLEVRKRRGHIFFETKQVPVFGSYEVKLPSHIREFT